MQIGDKATVTRSFNKNDIATYVQLGGANPLGKEIPEPLLGALFSYLLGMELPGVGTKYLKQETEYKTAAYLDEKLTASVEIINIRPEKYLVDLNTECKNTNGIMICSCRALVYVKDVKHD